MNIEDIIAALRHMTKDGDALVAGVSIRQVADLLAACRAAGFIGPDGKVRKVLGFYALNEDGTLFASEDDTMLYREPICGDVERAIASVELRGIDREYRWFLTREAALAAKEAK